MGSGTALDLVGWEYQGFVPTDPDQDAALHLEAFSQARAVQPDAIGVGLWFEPVLEEVARAIDDGIYVMAVNTATREQIDPLGISFVGQDFVQSGVLCATLVCEELAAKGVTEGVILSGTSSPGSLPLEQRYLGIQNGTQQFNEANGTNFRNETFPDESADVAQAIPLYVTKATQLGDDLVGFATLGTQESIAAYRFMEESGRAPGELVSGGFDVSDVINEGLQSDYLSFALDQQFYVQGFIAGIQMWMAMTAGYSPPIVYDTGNDVITKDTLAGVSERADRVMALADTYGFSA